MARQVMTGGAAWQGRMKQQTMQAYANEVRTGDTFVGILVLDSLALRAGIYVYYLIAPQSS